MTEALGMVEVRGLATALVAANLAVHTADVSISGFGYLHDGQVSVSVRGPVDAVRAAVEAIEERMPRGTVVASNVIARVAEELEPVLRQRAVPVGGRVGAPKVRGRGPAYRSAPDGDTGSDRTDDGPAGSAGGTSTGRRGTGSTAPRTRRSNPRRER